MSTHHGVRTRTLGARRDQLIDVTGSEASPLPTSSTQTSTRVKISKIYFSHQQLMSENFSTLQEEGAVEDQNDRDHEVGGYVVETTNSPAANLIWKTKAFAIGAAVVTAVIIVVLVLILYKGPLPPPPPPPQHHGYQVTFKRLVTQPVLTYSDSVWRYNYNSAFIPLTSQKPALAVRVQNLTSDAKSIFQVGPSSIAVSTSTDEDTGPWSFISENNAILVPDSLEDAIGVEDPRIVLHDSVYYMFYTAVMNDTSGRFSPDLGWSIRARLSLAVCSGDPTLKSCWTKKGALFPDIQWSKSGALIVRPSPPHLLLWGDSSIWVATSENLLIYNTTRTDADVLIKIRPDFFDSSLVESGPEPLPLSDGNLLFLYNSARSCAGEPVCNNRKPDWQTQYNLGWVVLDKNDPTKIIERASTPILTPELPWETCNDAAGGIYQDYGLTPNVVFIEGWQASGVNEFIVWYQGCDAFMGVAKLTVTLPK